MLSQASVLLTYTRLTSVKPTSLRPWGPVFGRWAQAQLQLSAVTVLGGSALQAGTCTRLCRQRTVPSPQYQA